MANKLTRFIDTWNFTPYHILNKNESAKYRNESAFQNAYANVEKAGLSPKVLCIVEGRFGKNNAISVNGRYYGDNFWDIQLQKEQTQFLLQKGLMWMLFGHVDRGIEDKDAEEGIVAGIVTHLEVLKEQRGPYQPGDLFGRAIIIEMGGKNSGLSVYSLLSVGSEISVSSRGLGEYIIGETYQLEDGSQIPIMNPYTYELETFDFTRLPGISDAEVHMARDNKSAIDSIQDMRHNQNLELLKDIAKDESCDDDDDFMFETLEISDNTLGLIKESMQSLIFTIHKQKENNMAKVDGIKVQQVLEDANAKIATLTAKNEDLEKKVDDLEAEKDDEKKRADELEKKLKEKTETIEAGTEPQEPAPVEEVKTELTDSTPNNTKTVDTTKLGNFEGDPVTADLEKYQQIAGTPEELNDILVKVDETLKACENDAAEIERLKAERDNLLADKIEREKELHEAEVTLESYVKLGSIDQLTAMVESNNKLKQEAREQKLKQFANHYSVKKGITLESVKKIIDSSKSIKAAKMVLESLPNVKSTKGLFMGESNATGVLPENPHVTQGMQSFAESMITKMESRRNKSYTV
jgi:hypothetical protein